MDNSGLRNMTTRKTLALNPLKKKGREWEISDKRLDAPRGHGGSA